MLPTGKTTSLINEASETAWTGWQTWHLKTERAQEYPGRKISRKREDFMILNEREREQACCRLWDDILKVNKLNTVRERESAVDSEMMF